MTEQLSTDIDAVDFFTDNRLLHDPYDYLAAVRNECPVRREPHYGVVMITGYEEAVAVYNERGVHVAPRRSSVRRGARRRWL